MLTSLPNHPAADYLRTNDGPGRLSPGAGGTRRCAPGTPARARGTSHHTSGPAATCSGRARTARARAGRGRWPRASTARPPWAAGARPRCPWRHDRAAAGRLLGAHPVAHHPRLLRDADAALVVAGRRPGPGGDRRCRNGRGARLAPQLSGREALVGGGVLLGVRGLRCGALRDGGRGRLRPRPAHGHHRGDGGGGPARQQQGLRGLPSTDPAHLLAHVLPPDVLDRYASGA
uniref:Uncharacterized protein n=1 Tax=Nonomuraea gerenzanensis TaxID=93944 RepID=A0A1M4EBC2_9ACTN|nr:hypothetical protein BN4615_P5548 [Nonomuraea gerenzanensis]